MQELTTVFDRLAIGVQSAFDHAGLNASDAVVVKISIRTARVVYHDKRRDLAV